MELASLEGKVPYSHSLAEAAAQAAREDCQCECIVQA